jgi:hypothetical protein
MAVAAVSCRVDGVPAGLLSATHGRPTLVVVVPPSLCAAVEGNVSDPIAPGLMGKGCRCGCGCGCVGGGWGGGSFGSVIELAFLKRCPSFVGAVLVWCPW